MNTILFVDDEVTRNKMLVSYLELILKWKVLWAKTIEEATQFYEENKKEISLILLDIMLQTDASFERFEKVESNEGLNSGIVFLKRILKNDPIMETPVIILSAKSDIQYPDSFDFIKKVIKKPAGIDKIVDAMQECFKQPQS